MPDLERGRPDVVTVAELAELLATTPKGVHHRRAAGQLPVDWYRLGRNVVWPRTTIDQFMQGDGARIRTTNQLYADARKAAAGEEHRDHQQGTQGG